VALNFLHCGDEVKAQQLIQALNRERSPTLAAGTNVVFVADQPNGDIQVRYSSQDMIIPASVVEVK